MTTPKPGDSRINPDTGLWEELVPSDDGSPQWRYAPKRIVLQKTGERPGFRHWREARGTTPGHVEFVRADVADGHYDLLKRAARLLHEGGIWELEADINLAIAKAEERR